MRSEIDLHMHSFYSDDGEFSPKELVEKSRNMKIISVSDHNCVRANAEALAESKKSGLGYICAGEFDSVFSGINIHILGYGIDYEYNKFSEIEKNISADMVKNSEKRLEKTLNMGFDISVSELRKISDRTRYKNVWTGEIFAEVILNKSKYKNSKILSPYRKGGNRSDNPYVSFYWDFYSQGKPGYVPVNYLPSEEIIKIIHESGGKAVLAHPGVNFKDKNDLFDKFTDSGIDGIEVFSSYHDTSETEYFYKTAKRKNLIITCGSDFHGKTKPAVFIGEFKTVVPYDEIENNLKEFVLY
ncbi:MAG: PHP domain-containing protein [Thermotogae bacterium]|nr:PHP domain-containing protein [Thermotogota bacterium]